MEFTEREKKFINRSLVRSNKRHILSILFRSGCLLSCAFSVYLMIGLIFDRSFSQYELYFYFYQGLFWLLLAICDYWQGMYDSIINKINDNRGL